MITRIHNFAMAAGMALSGYFYLAWFMATPNPDRITYWFYQMFIALPLIGLLGIFGLLHHQQRKLSIPALLYVGIIASLMVFAPMLPSTSLLWRLSVEQVCLLTWALTTGWMGAVSALTFLPARRAAV